MEVLLAQPRGFCAGVTRAIDTVERALEIHGPPVYVFHEIVHNRHVVERLQMLGAVFVDDLQAIPAGALTIFSAHGVSNAIVDEARRRGLRTIDATCPLVAKVHVQLRRYARLGYALVVIGHPEHDEVIGTVGVVDAPVHVVCSASEVAALPIAATARVAYVTQTTLSPEDTREVIAALAARFGQLYGPDVDDICYATQNRQRAVTALAPRTQVVLVVGAPNSSNSVRLREVAARHTAAYLIEDESQLDPAWLAGVASVGVTAGASAPESLVSAVCRRLQALGAERFTELPGTRETVAFRLPALQAGAAEAVEV